MNDVEYELWLKHGRERLRWPNGFIGCKECPTEYTCANRGRCLNREPVPELSPETAAALAAPNPNQTDLPLKT